MKNLATAAQVQSVLRTNSIFVEVDGSVRRITLDNLIESINSGDTQLLRSVAWGVPIKQAQQSSPAWGREGNLDMWKLFKEQCGRYLVKNNGHGAKLSKTNSGVYADGTPLNESIGHVIFHAPRLYFRVLTDAVSSLPYLWMSMIPIGGHFIEEANIGAYKGSMAGSALTSRSGATIAGGKTITSFWNAAQVNGKDWGLINYQHKQLMIMLLLSEYGNPDAQAMVGNGLTGTNNSSDYTTPLGFPTGQTKSLGDAFGAVAHAWTKSDGTAIKDASDVSIMGIENPYGQQWEFTQGIYCGSADNSAQDGSEVFLYEGNKLPSSAELASHPTGDYRQLSRLTSSGFMQRVILGEFFDIITAAHGGGGTSYWTDCHYANTTGQVVFWGGAANLGATCGLGFAYSSNGWSYSDSSVGSRLAYYGKLTVMSGAQLVAE